MKEYFTTATAVGKNIQVDDAKIIFKNFSGNPSKYNHDGDRNFVWCIEDPEIAEFMRKEGYNVREYESPDGDISWRLKINCKFSQYGPKVFIEENGRRYRLDEDSINRLDSLSISRFDMDIRPYDWEIKDDKGRSAYLDSCCAVHNTHVCRFEVSDIEEVEEV